MITTFHDDRMKRYVGGLLAVLGILLITLMMTAMLGACASIPHDPGYDGARELVEAPRCTDTCWVMSARNDNFYEARVYINGQRAATLPGMMGKAVGIPITRSMLNGAGCMMVFVKLYPDTKTAYSSDACPVPGSQLELAVDASYGGHPLHLWLQDWRRR
jgi:hypothetical protein